MKNQKEVLIIFKTHLDVGFTDYAENIVNKYLNEYIPNAIKVGYELKDSSTPFIWTLGSWMIAKALENDKDGIVERAIKDGILNWHSLPFTTHTELMNKELFEYALTISEDLDKRFNKKTIAAKMTDVPGHTIAMVPYLFDKGINFLHIGVNPATPIPPVPPIFKWKNGQKEITVMYQGDYGEEAIFDDFIIYFAHTGDNLGVQSAEDIAKIYCEMQEKYPDAVLKAATLNDVAERICRLENLPVIEDEIGDTWIHGAATDPQKISRFRKVLRYIENNKPNFDLKDSLLMIPEHTCGMDVKTFYHNDTDFFYDDLLKNKAEYEEIEKSWDEQRDYIKNAEKILNLDCDYPVKEPDLQEFIETQIPDSLDLEISWQIFDNSDYERYKKDYMRIDLDWAIWDFTKVGLPDYKGGIYTATITKAYKNDSTLLFRLEFPKDISKKYGLPYFYLQIDQNKYTLKWFDKKMCRLPQACWLKFKGLKENFEINKLGQWIKPESVIGSPLICAVDKGVRNNEFTIYPLDSALVAPFGRRLLQYNCKNLEHDLYFNLYNNIWNTNFPQWYGDDALFRFEVTNN